MIRFPAILPKVLIALAILGVLYALPWEKSDMGSSAHSWLKQTINEHAIVVLGDNAIMSIPTTSPAESDPAPPNDSALPTPAKGKTHISYGTSQCMPPFNNELIEPTRTSCSQHAPFPIQETRRIAIATISSGKTIPAYEAAIQTQMLHAAVHDTSLHILCDELAPGAWNKIAYLQHLTLTELLKPEDERLEWIVWMDRDAIIMDTCRPLSSFLPPDNSPEYERFHIVTNRDNIGFNAGIFMFRVSEWASQLFSATMAYPMFKPEVKLNLEEQTAMEHILRADVWKDHVAQVPQYWFNSYVDGRNESAARFKAGIERENMEAWRARKGDFLIHFAGVGERTWLMLDWINMLAEVGNIWEFGVKRDITAEITKYWDKFRTTDNEGKESGESGDGKDTAGGDAKDKKPTEGQNKTPTEKENKEPTKEEKNTPTEGENKTPPNAEDGAKKHAEIDGKKPGEADQQENKLTSKDGKEE